MKKIGSGKVREIYEVSDKELVIYTTDRCRKRAGCSTSSPCSGSI